MTKEEYEHKRDLLNAQFDAYQAAHDAITDSVNSALSALECHMADNTDALRDLDLQAMAEGILPREAADPGWYATHDHEIFTGVAPPKPS